MKRSFWCCLLWINCLIISAQTASETLEFARLQAAQGYTASALKAYQRVLFFARDRYAGECYAQLADLHAQEGNYPRSAFYYDLLYHAAPNDSTRYAALFGKAGVLLLQHEYQKSLIELLALDENIPEPWRSSRRLYLGAAYFGARDFNAAHDVLLKLLPDSADAQRRAEFERLFEKTRKIARKRPETATALSVFIPGAGQLYAGDVKNGLNSLLLNTALTLGFIAMTQTYSFSDALLTVTPWLFRYYAGGIKRTGIILEEKKEEKLRKKFRAVLTVLKKN